MKNFDDWCASQSCSTCPYDDKSSGIADCRRLYEHDYMLLKSMERLENKLDAIIKELNITVGED